MDRDNLATLFMKNKGKSTHNFIQKKIQNNSNLNNLEKFILLDDENMGNFYPEIDIYGRHVYSKYNSKYTAPVKDLYNLYNLSNGMRIFIPKNYQNSDVNSLIYDINQFGPENFGYVSFGDTFVPNYLSYEEKSTLSQFI